MWVPDILLQYILIKFLSGRIRKCLWHVYSSNGADTWLSLSNNFLNRRPVISLAWATSYEIAGYFNANLNSSTSILGEAHSIHTAGLHLWGMMASSSRQRRWRGGTSSSELLVRMWLEIFAASPQQMEEIHEIWRNGVGKSYHWTIKMNDSNVLVKDTASDVQSWTPC